MKKNIIIMTTLPLWSMNKGSGGKALFNTVTAYVNSDFNVYYITNQKNDYSKIEKLDLNNVYYINQEWYKSSSTFYGKLKTLKYYFEFERKSYKVLNQILKKMDKESKNLIYAYEITTVKSAKKASKKFGTALITRFQGTTMANKPNKIKYRLLKYPHIQALSTKADLVIMTDDGTQGDKVLDNYNNNSKRLFIRNGVNILDQEILPIDKEKIKKELGIPLEATVLLTVSRLEGWKKVDRSIMALNEIQDKQKYFLTIVGDGAEKENLQKLTKQLKLDKYVKFTGAIKNENVKKYMQMADIFLSFYDLSNVGNPLLEALCLGKPIITYNVGDTYKIIDGQNGVLLDDVSPKNIAENIEKMNEPNILNEYSKNALLYSKNNLYSWDKRMKIELDTVNDLINNKEVGQ